MLRAIRPPPAGRVSDATGCYSKRRRGRSFRGLFTSWPTSHPRRSASRAPSVSGSRTAATPRRSRRTSVASRPLSPAVTTTTADAEHRALVSVIDKGVKRGALHRNTGARKKARAARAARRLARVARDVGRGRPLRDARLAVDERREAAAASRRRRPSRSSSSTTIPKRSSRSCTSTRTAIESSSGSEPSSGVSGVDRVRALLHAERRDDDVLDGLDVDAAVDLRVHGVLPCR